MKDKDEKKINKDRPPVVVVLGHVDHGKSSLLEAIRDFKITQKESGGITQHIGAYEVEERGKKITFIDTPGHEAFSAMRARGAEVADIALLVIDSAQSVQPQTREAIEVIKKAGIPMIVVLNKIDLPNANPEKVKRELLEHNVMIEQYGGQVPCVEVSAKEKRGINELLEMILLVAEISHLESETEKPAEGVIIESYLDRNKGPVATAIVKKGILKRRTIVATDLAVAKIKNLLDFQGREIEEALPSQPVLILGFDKVPAVGEKFKTYSTLEEAIQQVKREIPKREVGATVMKIDSSQKVLNIVLKADVFGSLEAIEGMLKNLPQEKVLLRILKADVGDINENDVELAEMAQGEIIGFRVKITPPVMKLMKATREKKVRIQIFEVIYELIQAVRTRLEKMLEPEVVREEIGRLRVLKSFWSEKNRQIVGGKIIAGELRKGLKIEIYRPDSQTGEIKKVGQGKIINLQRNKKDVDKLSKGDEAGILFEGDAKIEEKDILIAFIEERRK